MKWSNSDFSRHYVTIKIQGASPEAFLTRCMQDGIQFRNIDYVNECCVWVRISRKDLKKLEEKAGRRYRVRMTGEGGYLHRIRRILNRKVMMLGIAFFVGIFIYQNLFITQIQVNGYQHLNEQELRETLKEAGFYEGCRKNVDLTSVKLHLYDTFDSITWVGIRYTGNLAQVTIAESGIYADESVVESEEPCNIVADQEGYISRILPKKGVRAAEDGQYVKKGDVLISGTVPLQNVAYGTEDEEKTEVYVHAQGTVEAKIPIHLTFYSDAYELERCETGNSSWSIAFNDSDPLRGLDAYETSAVRKITLLNLEKPIKLKVQLLHKKEVVLKEKKIKNKQLKTWVLNEISRYAKENLPDNAQILNKSLNFTQEKNIITIGVTLETLQEIGIEEEIIVDKSNGESEKNDDS